MLHLCGSRVLFCVYVRVCLCVCSSIYIVHDRGKTLFLLGNPLPEGIHRSPSSTEEEKKNPAVLPRSRMSDHREINTEMYHCSQVHQHFCDCGTSDVILPKSKRIFKRISHSPCPFKLCQPIVVSRINQHI